MFLVISATETTPAEGRRAQRINCISNLKQIGLSHRYWEEDNSANFAQLSGPEDAVAGFRCMSNELETPKILICPADPVHNLAATNFQNDFDNSHISYFINPDAREKHPQMLLCGDDNLDINDESVKSGLLELSTNTLISFTADRHRRVGNIAFADGSVAEVSIAGLNSFLKQTGFATNSLAIP
jgi:prepilin-type processing-associated H-X9-DG protein